MRVFISWSGPRSRKVAEYLSGWLRKLPLTVRPWVSKDAIDPGTRWQKELSEALEETRFGILCITPENKLEPWICFEAGALSKTVEKTHVIPYLIDMEPVDLKHPLRQFQAIEANKNGTFQLIKTIHKASNDDAHTIEDIKETFEALWPKLDEQIKTVKKEGPEPTMTKEADLPEIKAELDKMVVLLESMSSRMIKLESQGLRNDPWILKNLRGIYTAGIPGVDLPFETNGINYLREMGSEKWKRESRAADIIEQIYQLLKESAVEKKKKKDSKTK